MIKRYLKSLIVLIMMFVLTFSYAYVFAEESEQVNPESNPEINSDYVEGESETENETMPIANEEENVSSEGNEQTTTEDTEQALTPEENAGNAENLENIDEETSTDTSNLKSSDIYLTGDEIIIDYPIDGNLYVIANKVNIKAEVGGDAFIITKELNIEQQGYIFSNLFVVADNVNIDSVIYDMYAVAKNINITSNGSVYRDARIIASKDISILGNIGRNAFIGGSSKLSLTDGSSEGSINGNLTYSTSQNLPEEDLRAYVSGDISTRRISPNPMETGSTLLTHLKSLANKLFLIAIVWLICLWLAPKYLKNSGKSFINKPVSSVLLGLLVIVLTPVIAIILLVSKIALIASLLLFALFGLLLVVGSSLFSITLGNLISDKIKKDSNIINLVMALAVGIVVYLINLIPVFGTIVSVIMVILGIGSMISYLVNNRNQTTNV